MRWGGVGGGYGVQWGGVGGGYGVQWGGVGRGGVRRRRMW